MPVGEVAVFNCSLQCTNETITLTWYVVVPVTLRKVSIFPYTSLSQVKSVFGLDVSRNIINDCPKGGYHVEQLLVSNVTKDFDLMPVQCGLLCFPNTFGCKVAQILFSPVGVVKIVPKAGEGKFNSENGIAFLFLHALSESFQCLPLAYASSSLHGGAASQNDLYRVRVYDDF